MNKKITLLIIAIMLAATLAACGGTTAATPQAEESAPVAEAPAATEAPAEEVATEEAPDEEMAEEDAPADSDYILVTDDTGALEIAIPAEWEQIDGEIFITGNYEFASIAASSDLAGFAEFTTPGTWVLASATLAQSLGYVQNLDVMKNIFTSEGFECVSQDITGDYSDAVYEGRYAFYGNCAGSGNTLLILSVRPIENKTDHIITVIVSSPSDEPAEQAEIQSQWILDSFNVVGQLP
jgi:serine protease Do